jgi:hypothetical protein
MIGVRERVVDNFPSCIVRKFLLVNKDSQKLNRRDCWMRVVQLNLVFLSKFRPVVVIGLLKSSDNVANGSGTEKVLLLEAQFLTGTSRVVGVKHTGDVLRTLSL